MTIRYTLRALADLQSIRGYLEVRSEKGCAKVLAGIETTVRTIAEFPKSGRPQRHGGVRKLGVTKYPYNVYYRLDKEADGVIILRVRHAARRSVFRDV